MRKRGEIDVTDLIKIGAIILVGYILIKALTGNL